MKKCDFYAIIYSSINKNFANCSQQLLGVITVFITSKQLKERVHIIANEIALRSNGKVTFEEYIALPYYGYVILRFNLNENHYTVADVDRYESMMYDCVGDEFLIDFMGDVYRNIGIDYRKMDKLFANCLDFYKDEKLSKSSYAEMIENDAMQLLALCNLPTNFPVWEIQIEEEILLLVMGDSNKSLGQFKKHNTVVNVYQVASKPCEGLISAAFCAKRNNVSLANVLLKVQANEEHET